jgi:plasmid maintenance system killer protein
MIKNFADKITESIFLGVSVKRLDIALQKKILRRLRYIDAAQKLKIYECLLPINWKRKKAI